MKVIAILLFPILMFGQPLQNKSATADESGFKDKVDIAYANAMKGVYFAFENIPERKNSVSKDLISDNELIAKVKISKEVGGVFVQSVGFYNTYKVTAEIYRDYKSLKDEGLIEYIPR
ncbi:MAG: hypothetical protein L3J41_15225 [Melioribacteraceae bacterium]|nr:hypothetical protein [Melioribacteraceae bacterium]